MAEDTAGRVQKLEQSIENLESQVREQIARTRAGATTVLVMGIIVVALILIWLLAIAPKIRKELDPETLVVTVRGLTEVEGKIDDLIASLEASLEASASANVGEARELVMSQIPLVRKELEALATTHIEAFADQIDEKADSIFSEILDQHKLELTPLIEAAVAKEGAEELENAFRESLEETIGAKLDETARKFQLDMTLIEMRLDRLSRPDDQLTEDQKFEKQCIQKMLVAIDDFSKAQAEEVMAPPK